MQASFFKAMLLKNNFLWDITLCRLLHICHFLLMGLKEKPDIVDIIERKRVQWYGHVKRMQEERLPKLIME